MPNIILKGSIFFLGDDQQALIWDIQHMPRAIEDPILAYTAEGEINQIQWATTQPDWIGICYNNSVEILRVWESSMVRASCIACNFAQFILFVYFTVLTVGVSV